VHSASEGELEEMQAAAMRMYKAGEYARAEVLFRQVLEACPDDSVQFGVVCNNLAATLEKRGMPREAELLYLKGLAHCELRFPPDHPRIKHITTKLQALRKSLFQFPGLGATQSEPQSHADQVAM